MAWWFLGMTASLPSPPTGPCLHDASRTTIVMQVETPGRPVMLGRTYESENCSAARALEVVGERWSLLIIRDALFRNATRFSEFERNLGLAPNVLSTRLQSFVESGIMEARIDGEGGNYRYFLTAKGRDLTPVVIALTAWGDRWSAPNGPPVVFRHRPCGSTLHQGLVCPHCSSVKVSDIETRAGPGAIANQGRIKRRGR